VGVPVEVHHVNIIFTHNNFRTIKSSHISSVGVTVEVHQVKIIVRKKLKRLAEVLKNQCPGTRTTQSHYIEITFENVAEILKNQCPGTRV
jgi:hypothetical protein